MGIVIKTTERELSESCVARGRLPEGSGDENVQENFMSVCVSGGEGLGSGQVRVRVRVRLRVSQRRHL